MKHLISSLFILLACTCGRAQATYFIDTIAGNGDSARLRVVNILPNGSEETYSEPYDSTQNVLEYARVLFVSGGYVGPFRSDSPSEVEQDLRESIPLRDGIGPDRNNLQELLIDYGINPVENDTSYYASVVGEYKYVTGSNVLTSSLCATTSGTIDIVREFGFLWFRIDDDFIDYSVYPLSENMFQLINGTGKLVDVYVRDGAQWKSLQGCVMENR